MHLPAFKCESESAAMEVPRPLEKLEMKQWASTVRVSSALSAAMEAPYALYLVMKLWRPHL